MPTNGPHCCVHCQLAFTTVDALSRHIRKHFAVPRPETDVEGEEEVSSEEEEQPEEEIQSSTDDELSS